MTTMPAESFEWRTPGLVEVTPPDVGSAEILVDWESSGWKYLQVAEDDTTDRSAPAFDDSGWSTGAAAFGFYQDGLAYPAPTTEWDLLTVMWARRTVTVDAGTPLYVVARVEQSVEVYWNGALVGTANPGGVGIAGPFYIADTDVDASNTLAVRFADDEVVFSAGGQTYGDIQLVSTGGTFTPGETLEDVLDSLNLTAEWACQETSGTTMADRTGNGHTGTIDAGVTLNAAGFLDGDPGGISWDLNAAEGGQAASNTWADSTEFSAFVFVDLDAYHAGSTVPLARALVSGTNSRANKAWSLIVGPTGALSTRVYSATNVTVTPASAAAAVPLTPCVLGIDQDATTVNLRVDGIIVATAACAGGPATFAQCAQPFSVGRQAAATTYTTDGRVARAGYRTTKLSDAEWLHLASVAFTTPVDEEEPGGDPDLTSGWITEPDRTAGLVSISVNYGARDAVTKPVPLITDVELSGQVAGDCPPVSERFRLCLSDAAATALGLTEAEAALFTGEVTDPVIDPVRQIHRISGAGKLGRANRRTLAATDWPSEDDGARAARILTAGEIDAGTVDPGTVDLAAPEVEDTAGAMLDQVTDSSGGAVVEQPDGLVDYHDADHRRGGAVIMTLTPAQILNSITWEQHVDDVLNEVEVTWSGGTVKVREPASIETHNGVYPGRRSTVLTTASDAHSLGQLMVARRSIPRWQLPDLELDLMHTLVDDATRGDLLKLRHGDRILITDVPGPFPYSGDVEFLVEGWRQTVTRPAQGHPWRWRMVLSVSDPTLSGVSIRWMDFTPGYAWEDLPVGLSWLDLALIDDPSDL